MNSNYIGIHIREVTSHNDTIILWSQIASNLEDPTTRWSESYF